MCVQHEGEKMGHSTPPTPQASSLLWGQLARRSNEGGYPCIECCECWGAEGSAEASLSDSLAASQVKKVDSEPAACGGQAVAAAGTGARGFPWQVLPRGGRATQWAGTSIVVWGFFQSFRKVGGFRATESWMGVRAIPHPHL